MRGEQLARQWRIIRAIESSKAGLTVAELSRLEETGLRTVYRDMEALQDAGFPLYAQRVDGSNRWFFVDSYKFKVPPPFTLTELMALWLYRDLVKVFSGTAFFDSLESVFKKIQVTLPPSAMAYFEKIQSAFSVGIKPYSEYGKLREILNTLNRS